MKNRAHTYGCRGFLAYAAVASAVAAALETRVQAQAGDALEEIFVTGSRISRHICRTRAEWDRMGGLPED